MVLEMTPINIVLEEVFVYLKTQILGYPYPIQTIYKKQEVLNF